MSEKRLVLAPVFGRLTQVDSHVDPQWAMSVHKTWKDTQSVCLNRYTPMLIPTQMPTHPHERTGPHYNDPNRGTEHIRHNNSLFTVSQVKDKNSPMEWLNNMKRNSGRTVELISIALKNEKREVKEQFLLLGTLQPQTFTAELSLFLSHTLTIYYLTVPPINGNILHSRG